MNTNTFRFATFLALTTALISGVNTFLAKIVVSGIANPIFFTTLKNAVVAIFLVGVLIAWRKGKDIRNLNRSQWIKLIAVGVIGGFVPFALFFTGLAQTSAIGAALIHKTLFVWVLLLGIPFLKEKVSTWQWVGIAFLFVANFFVGGFEGFSFNNGELMILGATFLWAIENIIAKVALKDIGSQVLAASRMIIGSLLLFMLVLWQGNAGMVFDLSLAQWGGTILTSVLLTGYVLTWYAAIKRAPVTYVASLLVAGTLVTNVLSAVFVTHAFTMEKLVSSLLYIVGVVLVIVFAKRTVDQTSAVSVSPLMK